LEDQRSPGRGSAALFVALAGAAFAVSGPLARVARPAHPLFVAFGRVALASMLLFALDPRGVIGSVRALSRPQRLRILACGALLGVHFALFLVGLDRTSLPAAISLVSLEPLSVVVCAFLVHGVRPTRGEQAGVLLATAGATVVAQAAGTGDHKLGGDLLVLGSVSLYGLYVATARSLRDAMPPRQAGAVIYAVAAAVVALVLPFMGALDGVTTLPLRSFVCVVALAVIPTVLGHTAVQAAARHLSPAIVALVSPGETLGGLLIGAALLGSVPTRTELLGAAVILAGVTLAILGPVGADARAPRPEEAARAAARPD
jgi:drug/metabolite transporter (DMT)-like permease